ALPRRTTHFVSSRLRPDRLRLIAGASQADLGWHVDESDCQRSRRSTLSHWETRIARFRDAGLAPRGLSLPVELSHLPSARSLGELGFRYACHWQRVSERRRELHHRLASDWPILRFGVTPVPDRERFVGWLGQYYQSGYPLLIAASTL